MLPYCSLPSAAACLLSVIEPHMLMALGAKSSLTAQHLMTADLITDFLFEKCRNIKSHFWAKTQAEQHSMKMRMIRKRWRRPIIPDIDQYSSTSIIKSFQFYRKDRKQQNFSIPNHKFSVVPVVKIHLFSI